MFTVQGHTAHWTQTRPHVDRVHQTAQSLQVSNSGLFRTCLLSQGAPGASWSTGGDGGEGQDTL